MKKLLLGLLFVSSLAHADEKLNVECEGTTYETAKHNCFRKAIEHVFGSVVSVNREAQNKQLVLDEIIVYSAGYVQNYKIKSFDGRYMTMDLEISSSKIANRLLSNPSNANAFQSEKHVAQLQTHNYERAQGDRLLSAVMRDYPKRAFNLTQYPYEISIDSQRQFYIRIPYEIRWNYNWLLSFNEALENTKDNFYFLERSPGQVKIMAKNPNDFVFGKMSIHKFNDVVRVNMVKEKMSGDNDVRLRLIFRDHNRKQIHNLCFYPNFVMSRGPTMYVLGDPNKITIHGNDVERSYLSLKTPVNEHTERFFQNLNEIVLTLDTEKNCK